MDASPEQIVQDAMRQATVQLQSEGESLLSLESHASQQSPSDNATQVIRAPVQMAHSFVP